MESEKEIWQKRVYMSTSSVNELGSTLVWLSPPQRPLSRFRCVLLGRVGNLEAGERVEKSARGTLGRGNFPSSQAHLLISPIHLPHPARSLCGGESWCGVVWWESLFLFSHNFQHLPQPTFLRYIHPKNPSIISKPSLNRNCKASKKILAK